MNDAHEHNKKIWDSLKRDSERLLELLTIRQQGRIIQEALIFAAIAVDPTKRRELESLKDDPANLEDLKGGAERDLQMIPRLERYLDNSKTVALQKVTERMIQAMPIGDGELQKTIRRMNGAAHNVSSEAPSSGASWRDLDRWARWVTENSPGAPGPPAHMYDGRYIELQRRLREPPTYGGIGDDPG